MTLDSRVRILRWLTAGGILAGMALSPKLWMASRSYPLAPVFAGVREAGHPLDGILFGAFACAMAAVALVRRPAPAIAAAFCLGAALVGLDQSRLQPWFYEYLLIFGALGWIYASGDARRRLGAVNACRLLIASIYFWSGLQKINSNFAAEIVPDILPVLARWAGVVPLVESGIGLALLFPRTRMAGAVGAIGMHCMLLVALGPLGVNTNTVVWPWNVVMIAVVIVLFVRTGDVPARAILLPEDPAVCRMAALFVALSPALSFAGMWDNYPGWALYSGNKDNATYTVSDALFERLPEGVQDHVYQSDPGLGELDLYEWSWAELNAPVYPELRVYRRIASELCVYAASPSDLKMVVRRRALWPGKRRTDVEADCR